MLSCPFRFWAVWLNAARKMIKVRLGLGEDYRGGCRAAFRSCEILFSGRTDIPVRLRTKYEDTGHAKP